MAVAVRITPRHMTKDDYEKLLADLDAQGIKEPEGRLFHAAYGDDEVHMFEVWTSKDAFHAHEDKLFAVMQGANVDVGGYELHALHSQRPD